MLAGPRRLALICATLLLVATPVLAQVGAPLPQSRLQGVDWSIRSPKGLDRAYYFGGDNHTLSHGAGFDELERYIDPSYCAAPDPVRAKPGGGFTITVRVATPTERAACSLKGREQFISGLVTTQHSFSAAYGYWEVRASLPNATRTWPAVWLLPATGSGPGGGAAPEIDILEEYAGVGHGGALMHRWSYDRTGRPISAIHLYGVDKPLGCGETVSVKAGTWHTYGVLWEPTKLTFYIDEIATCVEAVSISDPHYLIINLAMDGRDLTPGPTSPAQYPATLAVDWVLHRPLRP